jgi:beta-galactosidase
MAHRHPDILRTEFNGMKRKFGGRHNSCPNSPTFHKYSTRLAAKLAEHYQNQDNIVAWHIGNEYGGICYCENCEKAFRIWLQKKYGTLEKLNQVWNTHFWGHTFYDWDEIVAPNLLTEHFENNRSMFPCITLDYYRFLFRQLLQNLSMNRS